MGQWLGGPGWFAGRRPAEEGGSPPRQVCPPMHIAGVPGRRRGDRGNPRAIAACYNALPAACAANPPNEDMQRWA